MVCNGSRLLAGEIPPTENTAARNEGTAAHYMASASFSGQFTLSELIDRKASNGFIMSDDMAEHVGSYLDVIAKYGATGKLECETSHDFTPHWVVNGRADFIGAIATELTVIDFKYGWRIVEPQNNWTLISHAIGYLKQHREYIPRTIRFSIFQPRPYHPEGTLRSWIILYTELIELEAELSRSLCNPVDQLQTSNHCNNCHALANCPAARLAEMNAIDLTETVYSDIIANEQLSFNLDNLNRASKMLKDRLDAFEELAKHRLKTGQVIANYSVEMGYGNSRWKDGIDTAMLNMLTGKDLSNSKLVTPAEAKRRGVDEITVKALSERPITGIKLQRIKADAKAKKMFG